MVRHFVRAPGAMSTRTSRDLDDRSTCGQTYVGAPGSISTRISRDFGDPSA
jgi:hypothetical protein